MSSYAGRDRTTYVGTWVRGRDTTTTANPHLQILYETMPSKYLSKDIIAHWYANKLATRARYQSLPLSVLMIVNVFPFPVVKQHSSGIAAARGTDWKIGSTQSVLMIVGNLL